MFNRILPEPLRFVNKPMKRSDLKALVDKCYRELGPVETAHLVDGIKGIGFRFATRGGMTIGLWDIVVPGSKKELLADADRQVAKIDQQFQRGLITDDERYQGVVDLWQDVTKKVSDQMMESLGDANPVRMMTDSGARGNKGNIGQLGAMRGLMADPSGRIIDVPVRSNFREGMTVLEYFISTHGARKGLADTALRTADSGYLTRRLVDVAQDVITREDDCNTQERELDHPRRVPGRGRRVPEAPGRPPCGRGPARPDRQGQEGPGGAAARRAQPDDRRGAGGGHRRGRHRRGAGALAARLRVPLRRLPSLLRPQPRHGRDDRHRRGGRHHRGPVDRRAGDAADHADVPHRRRRRPGHHAGPAARRGALRGPRPQGQGRDQPHRRRRRGHRERHQPQGQGHQPRGVRHADRAAGRRRDAGRRGRPRRGSARSSPSPRRATSPRRSRASSPARTRGSWSAPRTWSSGST